MTNTNISSPTSINKESYLYDQPEKGKMHPSAEAFILFQILLNFKDWFTPKDVIDMLGQLDEEQIQQFCLKFSPYFFATYSESNGTIWKFKPSIKIIT